MKNYLIYIVAIIFLAIGFATAWFLKPTHSTIHQHVSPSVDQEYTCSMHPQIRELEPGDCPICGMDLIPVTQNFNPDPTVLEMTPEAVKLANIQTTIVGEPTLQNTSKLSLNGKVQADERRITSLVSHVPGRIERLFVTFTGEPVQKGQKLVDIYAPDLINAQRELLEALKLKASNPDLVKAVRGKLANWKIQDSIIQHIEESGKIREQFTIYAAATGIVQERKIALGDYIKQGEPIFEVINLQKVWVLFDAYETDLAQISKGDLIAFNTPALPNQLFKRPVSFIDPTINPITRVASVRIEVANPGGLLKPEMLVYGTLQQSKNSKMESQITIPKSAVLWTGARSVVYVKLPEMQIPSFQYREIVIGSTIGDQYQVLEGLEAGEAIVTYGSFTIDAAAQLNNQRSMMNKQIAIDGEVPDLILPDYSSNLPVNFQAGLKKLADSYIQLKDALVATDSTLGLQKGNEFYNTLLKVQANDLKDPARSFWNTIAEQLQRPAKELSQTEEVADQRIQFELISEALIKVLKVFGSPNQDYYIQYCPMAFGYQGANWVSQEANILNPYFGDEMLTCGVVKEAL